MAAEWRMTDGRENTVGGELLSLNEELGTVNTELQAKVEELARATDDIQNLLDGIQVATIFVDDQLNVKRYTEEARELFNLIPADVGRPLSHLTSNIDYDRLIDDCRDVRQTLVRKEIEVRDRSGSWHLMRILPYRRAGNITDGVLITFVNVNPIKRAEEDLKRLNENLERRITERTKAIQMLHDVASMANQAQNTEQAIEYCLRQVAMYNGWCFGHAQLPAADNPDELVPAYACYAEDPERFRHFREVTYGLRLRRGEGLTGRVLASGKLQWSTDLQNDLVECRALVAEELGIASAVAFPILVGKKVAVVLEFFSDRVIQPDSRIAEAMVGVGLQLGRVIERAEFEEHLLTIAEEIQRGVAQDLHDDIGQELTGLGLKSQTLAEMLAPATSPPGKLATDIAAAIDRTHEKVRGLSRGMLPIELDEGLLASAIEQLATATSGSSRIHCEFACSHPDPVFDSRVSVHLYRIAQEAVSNALRHGEAQSIRISLGQENGETALRIEDDGTGLPAESLQAGGMGLRTMRYRAGLIGGKLEIAPGPCGGTRVLCRVAKPQPYIMVLTK